nr:MAG TPA: hypothetical protein [Caudoviricetes sp.]
MPFLYFKYSRNLCFCQYSIQPFRVLCSREGFCFALIGVISNHTY